MVLRTILITIKNYKQVFNLIEEFKIEASKKIEMIEKEKECDLIESKRADAVREIERCKIFDVDRDSLQDLFVKYIKEMGFDSYGKYNIELEEDTCENNVFLLRPEIWRDSDCICGLDDEEADLFYEENNESSYINTDTGFHSIDCCCSSSRVVNFWYKPTNLKISWYKYPFRDADSNQGITYEYLEAIMKDCKKSMLNDFEK